MAILFCCYTSSWIILLLFIYFILFCLSRAFTRSLQLLYTTTRTVLFSQLRFLDQPVSFSIRVIGARQFGTEALLHWKKNRNFLRSTHKEREKTKKSYRVKRVLLSTEQLGASDIGYLNANEWGTSWLVRNVTSMLIIKWVTTS